jgi:hypothetical protein
LSAMSEKERKKLNSKGIFTVTQLSYTFRPRRRPKQLVGKRDKYHHSLKALAIREGKIHISGSPTLRIEGTPVYLDIEGLPDENFYYLIGIRVKTPEGIIRHSLWANNPGEEESIWTAFQSILSGIDKPVLIHYGSFETTFFKRMCKRYGDPPNDSSTVAAIKSSLNLLSSIFAQFYFPTYTNGLKDIARYLGFQWSDAVSSGLDAIRFYGQWAESRDPALKQALLTYNAEDCEAVEIVANRLAELCQTSPHADGSLPDAVVYAEQLKRQHPYRLGRNAFSFSELDVINKAAYWDYQRERVYVKTNVILKRVLGRASRRAKVLSVDKTIECPRPRFCSRCGSTKFFGHGRRCKIIIDLKFMRHGLKRWIIRLQFHRYKCQNCGATFNSEESVQNRSKFGFELLSYAVYQNVGLRLPQESVDRSLNRIFGLSLSRGTTSHLKEMAAKAYEETYNALIEKLCRGQLLHIDETKVRIKSNDGFVWILANHEEVAYIYRDTREGEWLQTLLKDFKGVLVSDFYAAYDGIQCQQQKCLIHLIRDLNDDILKHPYDEELKGLALTFARLVKPMVDTVDRHGLKSRFLRKHLLLVCRFYKQISNIEPHSETAEKLKDRFKKNENKLFTFLKFDGVPWNNNNAEHAIKAFATLRQIIGGVTTTKGIRDYLILLSICETCNYQNLDFLKFLRSGEKSIDVFASKQPKRNSLYGNPDI